MIKHYITLMRPYQWVKNAILFAGVIFGKKLNEPEALIRVLIAFLLFSLIASCQYAFNDYLDRKQDALHPEKKHRPLASGALNPASTLFLTMIIFSLSMVSSYILDVSFFLLAGFYFVFNIFYSVYFKHIVILDVMSISIGFVIRAIAGALVVNVEFSSWLLLCTFMLSLFWGFSKRRGELILLDKSAKGHRKILEEYSVNFLDLMLSVTATMTLMSYVMYTVSPSTAEKLGTANVFYTIPIVVYAIFRSLYITYIKNSSHNPTKAILTDISVLVSGLIWFCMVAFLMYVGPNLNIPGLK